MKTMFLRSAAFICLALTSGLACAQDKAFTIAFKARINGEPFECGRSYDNVGSPATKVTPTDLRLYVSDVALIDEQGKAVPLKLDQDRTWQMENLALLDFENGSGPCRNGTPALNQSIRGIAPGGRYKGLRFTLGVPFHLNHGDPTVAPAPLSTTAMFWSWQGGYKFLKFDLASPGYSVHLGSTLCAAPSRTQAPNACQNPNRLTVAFNDIDVTRQSIVLDLGKVLAASDLSTNAPGTSPGCMSFLKDADCPKIMQNLGLSYEATGAGPQVLFSVE